MSRLKNKGIFVFFAALVTLYVIIYVVPKVTAAKIGRASCRERV